MADIHCQKILMAVCLFMTLGQNAYAGFEWTPPRNIEPPQQKQQPVAAPAQQHSHGTAQQDQMMPSVPSPVVLPAAPVSNQNNQPIAITPRMTQENMEAIEQNNVPKMVQQKETKPGFIIDPYPLRNIQNQRRSSLMNDVVEVAMMEQAGVLHALQKPPKPKKVAAQAKRKTPAQHRGRTPFPVTSEPLKDVAVPEISAFEDAVGFGRDLPLALSVSQIVPDRYAFSFSPDVNAGANVSWQGGRPWDIVLQDALQPLGMEARIGNDQVLIRPISGGITASNASISDLAPISTLQ